MSYKIKDMEMEGNWVLCDPIARYSNTTHQRVRELGLFDNIRPEIEVNDIKVVELFAGVGGFRIGLERASKHFKTIGATNGSHRPNAKMQASSIADTLGLKAIPTKI